MDRRLEPYRALVPFLGQALGPDYEVAAQLGASEATVYRYLSKLKG